jgi:hypothetical protein
MKVSIGGDRTEKLAIRLEHGGQHVSAILTLEERGWVLRYTTGRETHTRAVGPIRRPWYSALRQALADCDEQMREPS